MASQVDWTVSEVENNESHILEAGRNINKKVLGIWRDSLNISILLLIGIEAINITMLNNSTFNFIERIKEERPLWFEYFFVAAMTFLLIVANLLTWSLIKLINSRDQRLIDKLIKFHTIVINLIGK